MILEHYLNDNQEVFAFTNSQTHVKRTSQTWGASILYLLKVKNLSSFLVYLRLRVTFTANVSFQLQISQNRT